MGPIVAGERAMEMLVEDYTEQQAAALTQSFVRYAKEPNKRACSPISGMPKEAYTTHKRAL